MNHNDPLHKIRCLAHKRTKKELYIQLKKNEMIKILRKKKRERQIPCRKCKVIFQHLSINPRKKKRKKNLQRNEEKKYPEYLSQHLKARKATIDRGKSERGVKKIQYDR